MPRQGLDRTDRRILSVLAREGRIANVDLADRVNLSPTPCLERTRRLEREGYIRGYRAELDPGKLGAAVLILVQVTLERTGHDAFDRFREAVEQIDEVMECFLIAGNFDYLLKVRVPSIHAYHETLALRLTAIPGVAQTHSFVVLEETKQRGGVPGL